MNKKIESTYDKFINSLSPQEKADFEREHEVFLLEEMLHAAMKKDDVSVRKLAALAGVSPTIIQGIRSGTRKNTSIISFLKILNGLGYKLVAEKDNSRFSLNLPEKNK